MINWFTALRVRDRQVAETGLLENLPEKIEREIEAAGTGTGRPACGWCEGDDGSSTKGMIEPSQGHCRCRRFAPSAHVSQIATPRDAAKLDPGTLLPGLWRRSTMWWVRDVSELGIRIAAQRRSPITRQVSRSEVSRQGQIAGLKSPVFL